MIKKYCLNDKYFGFSLSICNNSELIVFLKEIKFNKFVNLSFSNFAILTILWEFNCFELPQYFFSVKLKGFQSNVIDRFLGEA